MYDISPGRTPSARAADNVVERLAQLGGACENSIEVPLFERLLDRRVAFAHGRSTLFRSDASHSFSNAESKRVAVLSISSILRSDRRTFQKAVAAPKSTATAASTPTATERSAHARNTVPLTRTSPHVPNKPTMMGSSISVQPITSVNIKISHVTAARGRATREPVALEAAGTLRKERLLLH